MEALQVKRKKVTKKKVKKESEREAQEDPLEQFQDIHDSLVQESVTAVEAVAHDSELDVSHMNIDMLRAPVSSAPQESLYTMDVKEWVNAEDKQVTSHLSFETLLYPPLMTTTATAPVLTMDSTPKECVQDAKFTEKDDIQPLKEEVLLDMFPHISQSQQAQFVDDFLSSCNNYSKVQDELFNKLKEYEAALVDIQKARRDIKVLVQNTKAKASTLWTLKKESKNFQAPCQDNIELTHSVTVETATFDNEFVSEMKESFHSIRQAHYLSLCSLLFKCKLMKLWIQSYFDQLLENMAWSEKVDASNLQHGSYLENAVDVLFAFEKRINKRIQSMSVEEKQQTTGLSTLIDDSSPLSYGFHTFLKDVRGWLSYLVSYMLSKRPLRYNIYLLLHCLRTPGIGAWGSGFIQWPLESMLEGSIPLAGFQSFNGSFYSFMDIYILGLKYLFSSLLEKEEKHQLDVFERLHVRESLKNLAENSDWIVLDEEELQQEVNYKTKDAVDLIVLNDSDYMALWSQFQLEHVWSRLLEQWKQNYSHQLNKSLQPEFQDVHQGKKTNVQLEILATYVKILSILKQSSDSFQVASYPIVSQHQGLVLSRLLAELCNALSVDSLTHLLNILPHQQLGWSAELLLNQLIVVKTPNGVMATTTLQVELGRCVEKTVCACLQYDQGAWWEAVSTCPLNVLSTFEISSILQTILGQSQVDTLPIVDLTSSQLFFQICRKRLSDLNLVFDFLVKVAIHSQKLVTAMLISKSLFRMCYVAWMALYDGAPLIDPLLKTRQGHLLCSRQGISKLCLHFDGLIGHVVQWSRELLSLRDQPHVQKWSIVKLVKSLPFYSWNPSLEDLNAVLDMLKDPTLEPHKFIIGKWVLQSLNWASRDGDLVIPRYYHRIVAFSLCNICLDRCLVKEVTISSSPTSTKGALGMASQAAFATVNVATGAVSMATGGVGWALGTAAGVVGNTTRQLIDWAGFYGEEVDEMAFLDLNDADFEMMNTLNSQGEDIFVSWCWGLYNRLALYHPSTSQSTYVFADNSPFLSRPFESINSPSLATLSGAMLTHPLAAYVMLLVSEIGHSWDLFHREGTGWKLLSVLTAASRFDEVIRVCLEVFPTMAKASSGYSSLLSEQIFEEEAYRTFFKDFWSRITFTSKLVDTRSDFQNVFSIALPSLLNTEKNADQELYVVFYMTSVCVDSNWISHRTRIKVLDYLMQLSFIQFQQLRDCGGSADKTLWESVLQRLESIHQHMWSSFLTVQSFDATAFSYLQKVVDGYMSKAASPLLLVGNAPSSISGTPSWVSSTTLRVEKDYIWFALEALRMEAKQEGKTRQLIGQILSKDVSVGVSEAIKRIFSQYPELQRPVHQFAIYRLAHHIVSIPATHPLFILFCQQTDKFGDVLYARFGYRFVSDQKDLLDKLANAFSTASRAVSCNKTTGKESKSLESVLDAMALWIKDVRLCSVTVPWDTLPASYEISRLRSSFEAVCLQSNRKPWEGLWLDLVPLDAIAKDIYVTSDDSPIQIQSDHHQVQHVDRVLKDSIVAPIYSPRTPMIPSLDSLTYDQVKRILSMESTDASKNDLDFIVSKAQTFKKTFMHHRDLDRMYLTSLPNLYRNDQKKSRAEKNCAPSSISLISAYSPIRVPGATRKPGSCSGAAVFDYKINEVVMIAEVKALLDTNREEVEGLLNSDLVDHSCCVSALRIQRACEWLKLNWSKSAQSNGLIAELATQSVYSLLDALAKEYGQVQGNMDITIEYFPPLVQTIDPLIQELSSEFIAPYSRENVILFNKIMDLAEKMRGGWMRNLSASLSGSALLYFVNGFKPDILVLDSDFSMTTVYSRMSDCITELGEECSMKMMEKFEFGAWLSRKERNAEEMDQMTQVLIENLEKAPDHSLQYKVHRTSFKRWIQASFDHHFDLIMLYILQRVCSTTVNMLELIIETIAPNFDDYAVDGNDFVAVSVNSHQLLVLSQLICDAALIRCQERDILKHGHKVLDVFTCCFLGQPIQMMRSETMIQQVRSNMTFALFAWFRVCSSCSEPESLVLLQQAQRLFIRIAIKQCQHLCMAERAPWIVWDWIVALIQGQSDRDLKSMLDCAKSFSDMWTQWRWNYSLTHQVLQWLESRVSRISTAEPFIAWAWSKSVWKQQDNILSSEAAFNTMLLAIKMAIKIDVLFQDDQDRSLFFSHLIETCDKEWARDLTLQNFDDILSSLPLKWNSQGKLSSCLKETPECALGVVLAVLQTMMDKYINRGPSVVVLSKEMHSKLQSWVYFILNLLREQLADVYDTESCFAISQLDQLVMELLDVADAYRLDAQNVALIESTGQQLMAMLNVCKSTSLQAKKMKEGLWTFVSRLARSPCSLLRVACQTMASVEPMAYLIEVCIERHCVLVRGSGIDEWLDVKQSLMVPELEEDAFIRYCLNHGLILTLFCCALQKLEEYQGHSEMRIMLGEQLGQWITLLHLEACSSTQGETKLVLLLHVFAFLLAEEYDSLPLPEHHSRLHSHLPKMAEILLNWSQDRSQQGLWATLGMAAPKSNLMWQVRLVCKVVGTFISTRLLMEVIRQADSTESCHVERDQMTALNNDVQTKLQNHSLPFPVSHIMECMTNTEYRMHHLHTLVQVGECVENSCV